MTARQLDLSCAEPWCACGNRAEDCTGDRVGCIERALGDGRLSILVDPPREHDGRVPFLGDASYESTETIRVVHLMSRSARGEIRGFVITDSDNRMHWRAPQPERWVAVDRAVASALGASWSAS